MQRSLARLLAAGCEERWESHASSDVAWRQLRDFARRAVKHEPPLRDLDDVTASFVNSWWMAVRTSKTGRDAFRSTTGMIRTDPRLQAGPVAEALSRRVPRLPSPQRSYSDREFGQIRAVARRQFRSALLRIQDSAQHLECWRSGDFLPGSQEWARGEALDILARTGDLPRVTTAAGRTRIVRRYEAATNGANWRALFLNRMEATSLGVLLMTHFGWNLAVISQVKAPQAAPDLGLDGHPTYQVPVRKDKGHRFETENVSDIGADSPGRLITQALEATRFARALVAEVQPDANRLLVWRTQMPGRVIKKLERRPKVGLFCLGLNGDDGARWGRHSGTGSPFQRGRRTVVAVERREASQHTQATHDRSYSLPDERVQAEAAPVIAAGAAAALRQARATTAKLVALVAESRDPQHAETATADCSTTDEAPVPTQDGGCGASFLLCLACENARVHADHHPRLVQLHDALGHVQSVLPPSTWARAWQDAHERLEDLRDKVGEGGWKHARARISDADRTIVEDLLRGDLNP
ncbi:hypothetical protein NE857_02010 [Nocardiopsis exhalans]|uniref:Integrase n=1 Tax=Nocardiopsis exhalans TaxID=163604 RepID=A0ABY5D7Y4_9ACTN|nr:hypothetical protein [Nocardiopsis exhalans]USY20459.1 hypothetical protein NE857_02010 [Nocardiopsis exhalans]